MERREAPRGPALRAPWRTVMRSALRRWLDGACPQFEGADTWMPGTSPVMTKKYDLNVL
jgi:hypothetical protein